jgi:hypothetical protein
MSNVMIKVVSGSFSKTRRQILRKCKLTKFWVIPSQVSTRREYAMRKQEIDYILGKMQDFHKNVSDLNITVGKPFQIESSGQLSTVDIEPLFEKLTPFQTEIFALNLIGNDRMLTEILLAQGSCDLSYELPGKAHFHANIFRSAVTIPLF